LVFGKFHHLRILGQILKMHQVAWPNENCTALSYKMPETSKVCMGYTMKKWNSNTDAIVLNTENWEELQQVQQIKIVIE